MSTFTISGNAGAANTTISWTGTSSGSTTADGGGNYSITELANGSYTITPTLTGYTFSPTSHSETISNANIRDVNFTTTSSEWSPVDDRNYGSFPLTPVVVQGSEIYALDPNSDNSVLPPVDSRKVKPKDDRVSEIIPENSRNNPNPNA